MQAADVARFNPSRTSVGAEQTRVIFEGRRRRKTLARRTAEHKTSPVNNKGQHEWALARSLPLDESLNTLPGTPQYTGEIFMMVLPVYGQGFMRGCSSGTHYMQTGGTVKLCFQ